MRPYHGDHCTVDLDAVVGWRLHVTGPESDPQYQVQAVVDGTVLVIRYFDNEAEAEAEYVRCLNAWDQQDPPRAGVNRSPVNPDWMIVATDREQR